MTTFLFVHPHQLPPLTGASRAHPLSMTDDDHYDNAQSTEDEDEDVQVDDEPPAKMAEASSQGKYKMTQLRLMTS